MGEILDRLLLAQSDRIAKAPRSGHPDVGGIYHVIVRLSLEPDRHFLGLCGLAAYLSQPTASSHIADIRGMIGF
jgi:hypothetical protein